MRKSQQAIDPQEWIIKLGQKRGHDQTHFPSLAISLYPVTASAELSKGLEFADKLLDSGLDQEALAAAIIHPAFVSQIQSLESIKTLLNENIARILQDVSQLSSLGNFHQWKHKNQHQVEKLRKMLLAMVADVRAVLIVLTVRLWELYQAKSKQKDIQIKLAQETMAVHAPLANRLGVWQLKWELEDISLRYLQPEMYSSIAKGLASRRDEREAYVKHFIASLQQVLARNQIQTFKITGRVKHIYSIYQKMLRKEANLEEIYDTTALRVLVPTVDDCYTVLGILQNHWPQIPKEFDDYISNPKPNGYQSIHLVLVGPNNYFVEVQIRTFAMHDASELGVAAHWQYKEGVMQTPNYDAKIALLRQLMAWQTEIVNDSKSEQTPQNLFGDKVYVFTPVGEIIDLAKGATPLDFAYHIHSEVGHRCRGAKVDGNIVPLTYQLQTGNRVEIITGKDAVPSRDWLNQHAGYLMTQRARARVQHWFRVKDNIQQAISGKDVLIRELRKAGLPDKFDLALLLKHFKFKTSEDFFAAIARGELKSIQVIQLLAPPTQPIPHITTTHNGEKAAPAIQILGIKNLQTTIASCCHPLPGDPIIGYLSRQRGLTIHRKQCRNVMQLKENYDRMLDVSWGETSIETYPVNLHMKLQEYPQIMRAINSLLAEQKIKISRFDSQPVGTNGEAEVWLTLEVLSRDQLDNVLKLLRDLPHILEISEQNKR